jgi:hypothetical protein
MVLTLLTTGQIEVINLFYESKGLWRDGGLHDSPNWFKIAFQGYENIPYCVDAAAPKCDNGMLTPVAWTMMVLLT